MNELKKWLMLPITLTLLTVLLIRFKIANRKRDQLLKKLKGYMNKEKYR